MTILVIFMGLLFLVSPIVVLILILMRGFRKNKGR